jgi:chemotaxis protein methyltransferase CheR
VPHLDLTPVRSDSVATRPTDDHVSSWDLPEVTITPALFARFQQLIYRETGIWLSESKTALLCGRLARRLRARQIPSLREYYTLVTEPDQQLERVLMIDAITTNETRFFREPRHFEYLTGTIFPIWQKLAHQGLRSRKIRVWSAGCSSGEEPYSLAMVLAENFPSSEGWDVRILATDISTRVLAIGREGIYRLTAASDIPTDFLLRFMLKGHDQNEGKMKVVRELRDIVEFKRLNLADDVYPINDTFDVIFCRNVLIYFDAISKTRVVEKLIRHLSPQGLLFIGHAENLHSITRGLKSVAPTVYLQQNLQGHTWDHR